MNDGDTEAEFRPRLQAAWHRCYEMSKSLNPAHSVRSYSDLAPDTFAAADAPGRLRARTILVQIIARG